MKFLVTGATGFIGSHVCRELHAHGVAVRAASRQAADWRRLDESAAAMEWVQCDLFSATPSALAQLCEGVDACIHCAWGVVPGEYLTSPENDAYRAGSVRLIRALIAQGCRCITGVGTCFEYAQRTLPLDEAAPVGPLTTYASAKLATYLQAEALTRDADVVFAWARLFYLYGPGEDPRRLVPDVTLKLLRGERAAVTSGRQVRDFLHVSDVARALIGVNRSGLRGPVNIGSALPVSVRDVVLQIAEICGRPDRVDFGARPDNLLDPPYVCADNGRLRRETGWRMSYALRQGLEQTVAWWKERA